MKKRTIISLFLVVLMAATMFTGCGGNTTKSGGNTTQNATTEKKNIADSYPEKKIDLICPYSAGGGSDVFGRAVAEGFNRIFKQTTIVTNKTGGSGQVAAGYVANDKKADPYTIMTANSGDLPTWYNLAVNYKDFQLIGIAAWDVNVLMVRADSPFNTLKDLIAEAKAKPGSITLAGTAVGSNDHLLMMMMKKEAGFEAEYIPFDGGGEVTSALLGGHVTCAWINPSEASQLIEAKKLKALAIGTDKRVDSLPNIPTAIEQGYNVEFMQFRGLACGKEVPKEYVEKLSATLKTVSESAEFKKLAASKNWLIQYLTPEEMKKTIDKQLEVVKMVKEMSK